MSSSRDTAKGEKYSIWKLSDLSSQNVVISLFLFGRAHQEHWKTPLGNVVALLNPNIMPSREVGSVNHFQYDVIEVRNGH